MTAFLRDLKSYLQSQGVENIFLDFMPEEPDECVALFLSQDIPRETGDGSGNRTVEIIARGFEPEEARQRCGGISGMLDSGADEQLIWLSEIRRVIARPKSRPTKRKCDNFGRVQYGAEIVVWSGRA